MRLFELPGIIRTPVIQPPPPVAPNPGASGVSDPALVKQVPIQNFGGDVLVGASSDVTIDATLQFGDRCTGLLLQMVTGTVQVSINGSALRTIANDQAINDASIRQVRIVTAAASSVILQLHGV